MAIYQINEVKAQCMGSVSSDATRTYTRILQLLSNDPQDCQVTALYAVLEYLGLQPGVPAVVIFAVGNDFDPGAYLKKIEVRQNTNKNGEFVNWEARLDYDSTLTQLPDNPLLRPTVVNGTFQMYQKPIQYDVFNQPILNTAKNFLEGIEIDDARPHVTMTRNEVTYIWSFFAQNYINFVNSAPFYGANIGQVKCNNVSGNGPITENNVTYFSVTYEFQFRKEGWQPSFLNRGRKDINGKPLVDANGNELDEPGFLKRDGTALQQPGQPIDPSQIIAINPVVYNVVDFNTLGLP